MPSTDDHKRILQTVDSDIEAWSEPRRAFQDDDEFAIIGGEKQWETKEWERRKSQHLPRITYNQMGPIIRSVCNGIAAKAFAISVTAMGDGASAEEAEFRAGVIRAIEITGNAQQARNTAVRNASIGGFGYYRIVIAPGDRPGKRVIKYQRIPNALTVVPDPDAQDVSLCDMMRCTVYVDLPKKSYEAKYPKGKALSVGNGEGMADDWVGADSVRVAEFWEVIESEDGTRTVKQTIIDGAGILDEQAFPGRYIPVFAVLGEIDEVAGKKIFKGIVRDAKEPQRFKNFWKSEEYEYLSGMKTPPALLTPGMVSDPLVKDSWIGGNNKAFRLWDPDPENPGIAPIFPAAPQIPSGYVNASADASQEIKVATGIHDARLGANTAETSGRALLVRQEQADITTLHFENHLKASIEHEGRVLNDLIPLVYSEQDLVLLANEDGTLETRELKAIASMADYKKTYGFNGGTYGVRVTVGPNYRTRREQFVSMLTEIGTKNPIIAQIGAPELIRAMDIPGSDDLAKQMEAYLVKNGMREPKQDANSPEIPPQVRQELEKMGQMVDQLTQTVERMTQEREQIIATAEQEKADLQRQAQAESELAQAQLDAQTEIQKAQIQSASRLEVARIQAQTDIEIAAMRDRGDTTRAIAQAALTPPQTVTTPELGEDDESGSLYPETFAEEAQS